MICPGCAQAAPSEVVRTLGGKNSPLPYYPRVRRCLGCGHTGETVEMWSNDATGSVPAAYRQVTGSVPAANATGSTPAAHRQRTGSNGGVRGGLSSDPGLSDLVPDQDQDHSDLEASESGARVRVRATRGPRRGSEYSPEFLAFWAAYPRKTGKGKAWEAWARIKPPLDRVVSAIGWQSQQPDWTKDGGAFIPHPGTWLNGSRWEDEPRAVSALPRATQSIIDAGNAWLKRGGTG